MLPTLAATTDWTVTSRFYRYGRGIRVGDVVSFDHPLLPNQSAAKRVLGMPGDFVLRDTPREGRGGGLDIGDRVEIVDGREVEMMVQVPQGHVWVGGDNLSWSRDSRMYGPVPMGLIRGKVVGTILPVTDARRIGNAMKEVDEME